MKKVISSILASSIILSTGCSAFRPHSQTVTIDCAGHSDAVLMVNGDLHAPPAQVELPRNRDFSATCTKEGYHSGHRTVGNHFNGTGALDAVGTLLVLLPGIGLLTPGAWSLDQTKVNIPMIEKQIDRRGRYDG